MKTVKYLALIWFAVTMLTVGAWAQAYPEQGQGAPEQSTPGQSASGQGASDQGAQDQEAQQATDQEQPEQTMDQTQGPPAEGAPGQGEAAKSEGPAPEVARISFIHGDVSRQRGDTSEWSATTINAPLERGDQIGTGEKSRTEIQLDYANVLRLSSKTQARIADLTRTRIQIQVAQGYANYTMLKGSEADVEVDTPNVAVRPLGPGRFRVQVNSDSETDVIVREGEVEISTPQGSTTVKAGQLVTIEGTDNPEYKVSNAPEDDDWDRWNQDRDHVIRDAEGVRKTNQYYTGVNDLDSYGRWIDSPGYGQVWQPVQGPGWAPYQSGRWVWEPYYGWTWVSYEPWGWAPYHYGRWFYTGGYWCWWPGPVYTSYRPLWSPAFVFFVGFGHHARFGFGSIGWFPIGPFDPFYPWYGGGFNRVTVISFTSFHFGGRGFDHDRFRGRFFAPLGVRGRQPFISNARLVSTDRHMQGAITRVSAEHFGRGTGTLQHGIDARELHETRAMTGNLPSPTRESMRTGAVLRPGSGSVQARTSGHFYSRNAVSAGQPSFHGQTNVHVGASGRAQVNAGNSVRNNNGERSGWSRFSGPGTSASSSGAGGHQGQSENVHGQQMDRGGHGGSSPITTHTPEDHGRGWQNFPSNTDHASHTSDLPANRDRRIDPGERSSGGKPPLDLNRPIVTPRPSETRMERSTPPPTRSMPPVYNQPRSTPSYSRSAPSYSRSSGSSGGYSRGSGGYSSHSSGGGGSHSSGGSSHSSGGGSHSSSSSRSSSGSKH